MRVLFVCMPYNTHYYPMVPLAWALRAAGHEVRVASQPELTSEITGTGMTAVRAGEAEWYASDPWAPDLLGEAMGAGGSEFVQNFDFARTAPQTWTWPGLLTLEKVMISTLFASFNSDSLIDDLVGFARSWGPDLVIWESFTMAGAVAAVASGAAHARLIYGPDIVTRARQEFLRLAAEREPEQREDPTAEWLGEVLQRYGHRYDETVYSGQWTIDVTPPSTRLAGLGLTTVGIRYVPHNGPSVVPDWVLEPPRRPRVCLTFGLSGQLDRSAATVADLLAGLADVDAEIIATLSEEQRAEIAELPANVRAVDFVPLHDLLPTCAAIVHHGGGGSRSTAEVHAVPQLILAYGWDTIAKAQRVEELGAGLYLPADQATPAAVRDGVVRLLTDPAFREGARRLQADGASEPTPAEAVPVLEKLVAEHRAAR